ncbi:hypothetical protein TNIN_199191 [Trichonephila inaurata madagascariensis]|uniref:Uncharacterized protein n=1 Tax=Trichonephila inaurata madagascariensis TaxID=2747483 RepID=A0A8X6WNW5_9ARAC|nr:hypothetical protein TNIN_199191 [Trichonephila inaurata madagascariensis]
MAFSTLMLTKIAESIRPFIVPDGQFEFNKSSFWTEHKSGVFQRYALPSIFRDLTRKGIVISYLDDPRNSSERRKGRSRKTS